MISKLQLGYSSIFSPLFLIVAVEIRLSTFTQQYSASNSALRQFQAYSAIELPYKIVPKPTYDRVFQFYAVSGTRAETMPAVGSQSVLVVGAEHPIQNEISGTT